MKNNPTGAMGVCDYLGWGWTSAAGLPVVNIPGCPAQPDNTTEALTVLVMALAGITPVPELAAQPRPALPFRPPLHQCCTRPAFSQHRHFQPSSRPASPSPRTLAFRSPLPPPSAAPVRRLAGHVAADERADGRVEAPGSLRERLGTRGWSLPSRGCETSR